MRRFAVLAPAVLCATAAGALMGHVPIIGGGKVLKWSSPAGVSVVIQSDGSDDLPDGSHETALRLAIAEWNSVSGTNASLAEDTSPSQQARTDWTSSGIHLLMFDETNASGYFPAGSGTVAVTPIWFQSNGSIIDADVLFNGAGFSFTTSGQPGRFDVGDVATHELGHFLGLDHTPWAGGTMYPYVDPAVVLHRSISEDERVGLRHAYPAASAGRITGTIQRASDSSPVAGAHVVARDTATGRTASSILSAGNGGFTIHGLAPGTYEVYAAPLGNGAFGDAPVDSSNIQGYTLHTDFESTLYGSTATITATETVGLGTLPVGDDVTLNLGTNVDEFPVRVIQGDSRTVVLRGAGLNPTSTLEASDPDLVVGTPMWFGSSVSFQLTVPAGEAPGHVDLMVTNSGGERSILTAGLEITPPSPTVASVAPAAGAAAGGDALTLTGTGFLPGARVVIGDRIYTDGVDATVVDPTTITLVTQPTAPGSYDVVVIDATGVEGRLAAGFGVAMVPVLTTVFPDAGDRLGGTAVVLTGADFEVGADVRIDGVSQAGVLVESATRISFTTVGGAAGLQLLEVVNPGGALVTSAFLYTAQPDPTLTSVTPGTVKLAGDQTILLTGTDFPALAEVEFGADPDTGEGGLAALSVLVLDPQTIEVITPAFSATGPTSVLVRDAATGQAVLEPSAVLVKKNKSGGGGGACSTVPAAGPPRPMDVVAGGWWMLLVLLLASFRARRSAGALRIADGARLRA